MTIRAKTWRRPLRRSLALTAPALLVAGGSLTGCSSSSQGTARAPTRPVVVWSEGSGAIATDPLALGTLAGAQGRQDARLGLSWAGDASPLGAWPVEPRPSLANARRVRLPDRANELIYYETDGRSGSRGGNWGGNWGGSWGGRWGGNRGGGWSAGWGGGWDGDRGRDRRGWGGERQGSRPGSWGR